MHSIELPKITVMKSPDLPAVFSEESLKKVNVLSQVSYKTDPRMATARVARDMELIDSKGGGGAHAQAGK